MISYYLGIRREDNEPVYLKKPSWDCDWYWGFGYLSSYSVFTHFDCVILKQPYSSFSAFKDYFVETPLSDDDIWVLCDYMLTYYTLKKSAELFRHGNSWQTSRATIDCIADKTLEDRINKEMLPALFKKIDELFSKYNKT